MKIIKILALAFIANIIAGCFTSLMAEDGLKTLLYQYALGEYYSAKNGVDGTFDGRDHEAEAAFRKQQATLKKLLPKLPLEERKAITVLYFFSHGGVDGEACTKFYSTFFGVGRVLDDKEDCGKRIMFDRKLVESLINTPDKYFLDYCHHMNVNERQVRIFKNFLEGAMKSGMACESNKYMKQVANP